MARKLTLFFVLLAVGLAGAGPAHAVSPHEVEPRRLEERPLERPATQGNGPYELSWSLDLPIFLGSAALWSTMFVLRDGQVRRTCPCSSDDLPGFERIALGRSSAADTVSDVVVGAALAAPLLLDALDVSRSGGSWQGYWEDMVVVAEALLANGSINEVVKTAASRPRPRIHDLPAGADLSNADDYTSFYSAHTSNTFAVGMAYAFTYANRHPDDPMRWAVYGGAVAVGAGVGALRVAAGAHFPSDVIVGGLAGATIGTIVPWLHLRSPTTNLAVAPTEGGAVMAISGLFP